MKQSLKKIIPHPIWALGSNAYWGWHNRGRHSTAKLGPTWRQNQRRLEAYRDAYQGARCFIIGNGPSLRQMDLSLLRDEYTFGMNRIYLMFPELGFTTKWMVIVNDLVLEQCAADLAKLDVPMFVTWRARRLFHGEEHVHFLDTDFTGPEAFSGDLAGRLFEGFTVTNVALQLAFAMGFSEAILIGVDHNYTTQGTPNAKVVSQGDDPNHFAPQYFGKGFVWQLPDLAGSERGFRRARVAYEQAGRRVVDATVGGKLEIFTKVDYTSLFQQKQFK